MRSDRLTVRVFAKPSGTRTRGLLLAHSLPCGISEKTPENQERKGGTERSYRLAGLLVAGDWLTLLNFYPFHLCPKVLLQIIRHRVCALLEVFRPCF